MLAIPAAARSVESIRASAVGFAVFDMVPHVAARKPHQRPQEFSFATPKRLLQQYRHLADIAPAIVDVRSWTKSRPNLVVGRCRRLTRSRRYARRLCPRYVPVFAVLSAKTALSRPNSFGHIAVRHWADWNLRSCRTGNGSRQLRFRFWYPWRSRLSAPPYGGG